MLEIPPAPGRTVIPRTALIVDDGHYYVFVQEAGKPDKFERRVVGVAQEKDDHVVIDKWPEGRRTVGFGGWADSRPDLRRNDADRRDRRQYPTCFTSSPDSRYVFAIPVTLRYSTPTRRR